MPNIDKEQSKRQSVVSEKIKMVLNQKLGRNKKQRYETPDKPVWKKENVSTQDLERFADELTNKETLMHFITNDPYNIIKDTNVQFHK